MRYKNLHYAWFIVLCGVLTLFACLGLGRFALGMLLPSMGSNLSLSYSEMGLISTGNFVGYLLAVLLCGFVIRKVGERKAIFTGLLLVGSTMIGISQSESFIVILALYCATGIGSGMANITIMTLVAHWFSPRYRGRAAGYMIVGNGLGIVFSGLTIPWFNQLWPSTGWSMGWLLFGSLVIVAALIVISVIKNRPSELNLNVFGEAPVHEGAAKPLNQVSGNKVRVISLLGGLYFLFGFTYVIYATFIVTTLVEQYHFSESIAGTFWIVIGVLSVFSGAVFGGISDKYGRKIGLFCGFMLQGTAYLLAASELNQFALFVSMTLFGISAFAIPAIIAASISDLLGPKEAASMFGLVTFFFGIGQITGPSLAGFLAEQTGTFSSGYFLAAAMAVMAAMLSLLVKPPRPHTLTS